MNRAQRRQRKRSDVCIFCCLADGTMDAEDFRAHCCEVARAYGVTRLDGLREELCQHARPIDPALVSECVEIVAAVRLVHSASPLQG